MNPATIDGPIGPFLIPSEPSESKRICAGLSRGVWGTPGRYDLPDAGVPEYEHAELSIPGIGRVLDIGAGWGAFAVWAIARWGKSIDLWCYEPGADGYEYLTANLKDSGVKTTCIRSAISTEAEVFLARNDDWGCRKTTADSQGEAVTVIHPRDLPPCDILKCDAEGIEPALFAHYPYLKDVKAAIYEWHTPDDRRVLRGLCEAAGLRCVRDDNGPWGDGNGAGVWVKA